MSPHAVNSFVSDLVTMAQAMERLPQIEHELSAANAEVHDWKARYDLLALDLEQSRSYATKLEAAVHDAEVAKDAAETMFLQADDRTMRAVEFIKAQFGAAGSLIQALEPERAKPVAEETVREETLVHPLDRQGGWHNEEIITPQVSEVKPIAANPTASETHSFTHETAPVSAETSTSVGSGHLGSIDPPQGQSEPDPTAGKETTSHRTESSGSGVQSETDTISSVPNWAAPAAPDTKPQPYAGLSYQDYPRYVSYNDWIDGGGTSDTYYYPLHRT